MASNLPQKPNKTDQVAPELIERFLDLQSEDLKLKQRELDFRLKADTNSFEYAKLALKEKASENERKRTHDTTHMKWRYVWVGVVVVIVMLFIGCLAWLGKDQLVRDILNVLIGLIPGGVGGYAYGKTGQMSGTEKSSGSTKT